MTRLAADIAKPFDLTKTPGLRLHRYHDGDQQYLLMLWHHIAFDGWSSQLFLEELATVYHSICRGKTLALPPQSIQYGDFAKWQREYLQGERLAELTRYWQANLADAEPLDLPLDYPRPATLDYRGADILFALDGAVSEQLRELAKARQTTLNCVLLGAFKVTLSLLSGQQDIVIGTPSDNRHYHQTQSLIGLFVNTLVLRTQVEAKQSVGGLLARVHQQVIQAKVHQDLPFEQLLDSLNLDRDTSRHPLFQVMFGLQTTKPDGPALPFKVVEREGMYSPARFDLSLYLDDGEQAIGGVLNYAVSLFKRETVQQILTIYTQVLRAFVDDPSQLLGQLSLASALPDANYRPVPSLSLCQLFERQVDKTPDHTALVFEGQSLSYLELNEKANALAWQIEQGHGQPLAPDTPVALCFNRSLEMVISSLAVLKAGGAYVPLDPAFPKTRLDYILNDTRAPLVLVQPQHSEKFGDRTIIEVCAAELEGVAQNLPSVSGSKDLAYILYTSGTTGQPKGVMVEHGAIVNRLCWQQNQYPLDRDDKVLLKTPYTFDVSVWELFWANQCGATLVIAPDGAQSDPALLLQLIEHHGITTIHFVPSMLEVFCRQIDVMPASLKRIICSGEALCAAHIDAYSQVRHQSGILHNLYGPTEAAVDVSYFDRADLQAGDPPIGKAIDNIQLYVLSQDGVRLPDGAPGELYIGGIGLARGYLNKPELTAKAFVDNPFGPGKLYKTGDKARFLADGNIQYMGRLDSQLKIRGMRVEPGEITSALTAIESVKQAAVINIEQSLVAYVVAEGEVEHWQQKLAEHLPSHLVPQALVYLEQLPLSRHGKLDTKALPAPHWQQQEIYVAPQTPLQQQLCDIWQQVLGLEQVGIEDNFFRLGGNSISAVKLVGACGEQCQLDLPLATLFKHKTIAAISEQLFAAQDEALNIEHVKAGRYPLSYAQQRLLFIERFEQGSSAYHIPIVLRLTDEPDVARFNEIAVAHPVINSVFLTDEQGADYCQPLDEPLRLQEHRVDDGDWRGAISAQIAQPFDLSTQGSLQLHRFTTADGQYLLILWHHIAFDQWSLGLFIEAMNAERVALPTITYGDYARWQQQYLQGERLTRLQDYWQQQLAGVETLALPTDHTRPAILDHRGDSHGFEFDPVTSSQLRQLAREYETTLYTVLLSGFYLTLAGLSGQSDIVVGTPSDNRHHGQTQNLIGFFVNSLVLRLEMPGKPETRDLIARVHRMVGEAKAHQDLPFEQLVELLQVPRDLSRHPLYQVMFTLQNGDLEDDTLPFGEPVDDMDLYHPAKFDLSLSLFDLPAISGEFNYALSLFEHNTVAGFAEIYQRVMRGMARGQQHIKLLSEAQRQQQLVEFNRTAAPQWHTGTIHQLLEAQVVRTPQAIALVCDDEQYSYSELNHRANQLARLIEPHDSPLVVLYLDRGLSMVAAIFAVLKAGKGYVPISPEHPDATREYILSDSQPALVLTNARHASLFAGRAWLDVDSAGYDQPGDNLDLPISCDDTAFVLYTSGTTGRPKGVMMGHGAVCSRSRFMSRTSNLADNVYLFKTNYIFDVSVADLFGHLPVGAKMVMTRSSFDLAEIKLVCQRHSVNATHLVPSQLLAMGGPPAGLSKFHFSGEDLTEEHLSLLDFNAMEVHNHYGPTEAGEATWYQPTSVADCHVIGKPFDGVSVYVLNEQMDCVPLGSPGQLYIGGVGLAKGYLNLPQLTAERFIDNPFGPGKIYQTGDLVRFRADGNLVYMGRIDNQVKIRGFRVELSAIESVLAKLPGVHSAVVLLFEHLAAYIVPEPGCEPLEVDMRRQLAREFPEHMVPTTFTLLDKLPLTPNGKLDKRALPKPELSAQNGYVAPANALQQRLCDIWAEVLGLEKVGIEDNFFAIGGHSLSAVTLVGAIERRLEIAVPLATLFGHPTIARLAPVMGQGTVRRIEHVEQADYPLSHAQQRMLFLHQFGDDAELYHIPYFVRLDPDVDLARLQSAIARLVARHPILTTLYHGHRQQPSDLKVPWRSRQLADENALFAAAARDVKQPFDLAVEPAMRVCHYAGAGQQYLLLLWHHIGFDGQSLDIFLQELALCYRDLSASLPSIDITYGDYALSSGQYRDEDARYWTEQLEGYANSALPTDWPRPDSPDHLGANLTFVLAPELIESLRKLAAQQQASFYTVMLSGFYVTLSAYSGQKDWVIGTPSDNRNTVQLKDMIGLFVNSLVLRARVDDKDTVATLIAQVHTQVTQGKAHQDLPFEKLIELLDVERDISRNPIFQVMFSLLHFGQCPEALPFTPVDEDGEHPSLYSPAKFDLSLFVFEGKSGVELCFNYATALFKPHSIDTLAGIYQSVLTAFVTDKNQPLGAIDIVAPDLRQCLLQDWSQSGEPRVAGTVLSLFEAQVAARSDAVALCVDDHLLSYAELSERVNALAQRIVEHTGKHPGLIALYLDRSVELVVSLLAVMKAGGAYVPIALDYPRERAQYILNDTDARLIITQTQYQQPLAEWSDAELLLADEPIEGVQSGSWTPVRPKDMAYVLYTSGTTGDPKGVMVNHGALANIVQNAVDHLSATRIHCLSLTQYTFDIFGLEYAAPLVSGGTLVLSSLGRAAQDLAKYRETLNFIQQTPSMWQAMLARLEDPGLLSGIETMVGGERGSAKLYQQLQEYCQTVFQVYGPTETCIWSTVATYQPGAESVIGRPFAGESVYVLNDRLEPVPPGVVGQLYIGGTGLAMGYFNQAKLTAQRFVEVRNERLYQTGDLVRWLADGTLAYMGRNDSQIKIRGHRVELGEVENRLLRLEGVEQVAVIECQGQLAAYVVSQGPLTHDLSSLLPSYMVPGSINLVNQLPMTVNGKLDTKALPKPSFVQGRGYVAPRNPLESRLCDIWQQQLGLDLVGIDDHFFALGGHSINAIELVAVMGEQLAIDVPLAMLFEQQTIAKLAGRLQTLGKVEIKHIEAERYPLSFAQARMLFIEQFSPGSDAYHIPLLVEVAQAVDRDELARALALMTQRHAILRTIYPGVDYQQVIQQSPALSQQSVTDTEALQQAIVRETRKPFDLTCEPGFRASCYLLADGRQYLLLVWHHISFDGWSGGVFMDETGQIVGWRRANSGTTAHSLWRLCQLAATAV